MDPSQKPLIFFHIVQTYKIRNALVFTKSAESTTRLVRLFEFFERERTQNADSSILVVRSYSSDLPVQERKTILEQFKNEKINLSVVFLSVPSHAALIGLNADLFAPTSFPEVSTSVM